MFYLHASYIIKLQRITVLKTYTLHCKSSTFSKGSIFRQKEVSTMYTTDSDHTGIYLLPVHFTIWIPYSYSVVQPHLILPNYDLLWKFYAAENIVIYFSFCQHTYVLHIRHRPTSPVYDFCYTFAAVHYGSKSIAIKFSRINIEKCPYWYFCAASELPHRQLSARWPRSCNLLMSSAL